VHYILVITYSIWFLSEIAISRILKSSDEDRKDTDKSSIRVVWIVALLAIFTAILVKRSYSNPIFSDPIYRLTGAVITLAGMVIRIIAVKALGRMFTVDVTIRQNHELKTEGIYKHIRHPAYAGLLMSFYGLGLAMNNWWSLLVVVIPITIVFIRRIKMEEAVLEEEFGEAYAAYRRRSKSLIPFIY
jgi:protein-S-isoprenylcysteine O-methyltransferase Ste14